MEKVDLRKKLAALYKASAREPALVEVPAMDFLLMHAFIHEKGYEFAGKHHEIYLSDPRRTKPDRLKTILRQPVRKAGKKR